jgi:hypothetical protein
VVSGKLYLTGFTEYEADRDISKPYQNVYIFGPENEQCAEEMPS